MSKLFSEFNRMADSHFNYKVDMEKKVERVITPKRNDVIGTREEVIEKKSKLIIAGDNKSVYPFGKIKVTHIGPDVKDVKVGEYVYIAPTMAMPLNLINGIDNSDMLVIFSESAVRYSVTQ